jgi:translation initiation factor 4E
MSLSIGSNYHLFKVGIKPVWEHEVNRKGGKWIMTIPLKYKGKVDSSWLHLCLALVGEHFTDGDEICGVVISIRKQFTRTSLWTRTAKDRDVCMRIGRQFREFCDFEDSVIYQAHADALQNDSSFGNKPLYIID